MSGVQKITVKEDENGMRLDRWFKAKFPALTHGQLEKLLRKGHIRVSGGRAKSNRRLETGEEIRVPPVDEKRKPATVPFSRADKQAIAKMTIYEDDDILVVNKPFGLAVQGGSKTKFHIDGMLQSLGSGEERVRLVHRLDKDTGGLLVTAKTRRSAHVLGDAFKDHEIEKTYWALTADVPRPMQGTIDLAMEKRLTRVEGEDQERVVASRRGAQKAMTDYQVLEDAGAVAFVAMRPITGRTHQLRVHAAAIETPIVGDGKYGGAKAHVEGVANKLHLFCRELTFRHPRTRKLLTLSAPLTGHMFETWSFFNFDQNALCEWPEHD